jgi:carboxymethylenebutenolidase
MQLNSQSLLMYHSISRKEITMRLVAVSIAIVLLTSVTVAQEHHHHEDAVLVPMGTTKAALEESPRHHEWVDVKSGNRKVATFVAYPEAKEKALAVVVIHENRGLDDWARSFADQLAGAGYIAVAPDLLSDFDGKHHRTSDFESTDAATQAIYKLDPAQVTADLRAVRAYAASIPASNGKTAVAGFCWGGMQSFRFATDSKDLVAAFVFYGAPPDSAAIPTITAPVYAFYGGNDERINASIPATERWMKQAGKKYDYLIYDDAGHAYMRLGEGAGASEANRKAREESWDRLKSILSNLQ